MMNIFQIWEALGQTVPFAVRRYNWPSKYYAVVEAVEIRYFPYGVAYGYPTINGEANNHFDYHGAGTIPNAGSYQWSYVPTVEVEGKLISVEMDEEELLDLGLLGKDLSYLEVEPTPTPAPDTRYPGYQRGPDEEVEWFERPIFLGVRTDVPGDCRVVALGITDKLEERTTSALVVGNEDQLNLLTTLARAESVLGWRIDRAGDMMDELESLGITAG